MEGENYNLQVKKEITGKFILLMHIGEKIRGNIFQVTFNIIIKRLSFPQFFSTQEKEPLLTLNTFISALINQLGKCFVFYKVNLSILQLNKTFLLHIDAVERNLAESVVNKLQILAIKKKIKKIK